MTQKPRVFIGSSSEHIRVALSVQEYLEDISDRQLDVKLWNQGVFRPGSSVLESLIKESGETDFGIFVFAPDDVSDIRGENYKTVRDNILFEFGLFIGRLGRDRTFMLVPRQQHEELKLRIATDLLELTCVGYDAEKFAENDLQALGSACSKILREITHRHQQAKEAAAPLPAHTSLPVIAVGTPANPMEDDDDTCKRDKRVREEPTTRSDSASADNSNLYYILFSDVANCEGTRKVVREVAQELRNEPGPASSFRLAGMYDTMGRWDVVVRFRLNEEAGVNPIMVRINRKLVSLNLKWTAVALSEHINVQLETDLEHGLGVPPAEIKHFRMKSTAMYEDARCQRLFLYIGLPDVLADAERFIGILLEGLRSNKTVASVIESVSISAKELILEIFATCSQTHIISMLNREVEKVLPRFMVSRKYTLTCFYYDEKELVEEE